jgi:hypothetical protein
MGKREEAEALFLDGANCAQAVKDAGATIVADKNHDALADVIAILDKYYA